MSHPFKCTLHNFKKGVRSVQNLPSTLHQACPDHYYFELSLKNNSIKYVVHLIEEELKNIIDESIKAHTMQIKKAIDDLAEQRDNELLKIDDAMKILKVSRKTINNWIESKKLRCHWLGGRLYFKMIDIMECLNSYF